MKMKIPIFFAKFPAFQYSRDLYIVTKKLQKADLKFRNDLKCFLYIT